VVAVAVTMDCQLLEAAVLVVAAAGRFLVRVQQEPQIPAGAGAGETRHPLGAPGVQVSSSSNTINPG